MHSTKLFKRQRSLEKYIHILYGDCSTLGCMSNSESDQRQIFSPRQSSGRVFTPNFGGGPTTKKGSETGVKSVGEKVQVFDCTVTLCLRE